MAANEGDAVAVESDLLAMDAAQVERGLHDFDAAALAVLIQRANREYWDEAAPTLPDPLYDRLVERLRRLHPDAAVLQHMGPTTPAAEAIAVDDALRVDPTERFGATVRHSTPMLSLEKAYTDSDMQSWAAKFEGDLLLMPKLDGVACSVRYDDSGTLVLAATRGSGTEGEDVTANVLEIADLPSKLPGEFGALEVRGEIYMRLSVFERYKGDFANPRNLTAGAIKQKDRAKSRAYGLSFAAYDAVGTDAGSEREKMALLSKVGVPTAEYAFVERGRIEGEIQAQYEAYARRRMEIDYEIDGVVFRADLVREQQRLGETGHHPRYAIAYKFQGDTGQTRLRDVQWSVSRTGTITPVAMLEPIELSGAMVGRAGLHNLTRFRELGVTRGCLMEVTRRGGVIPHVERVVEPGPGAEHYGIPTHCPACGNTVVVRQKREGEFLQCADPSRCVTARLRELEHFAKIVDMQGFGPKVVTQVVERGLVSAPADFFRLDAKALAGLERLADKSARNLVEQAEAHRTIELATFLEALGIDHLGQQNARLLAGRFGELARIRGLGRDDLMEVKGIKEAIADAIIDGLNTRTEMIDDLLKEVTVPAQAIEDPSASATTGPLSGRSFVFTGTLEAFDRKTAQARVRDLGGETPGTVSKSLTYLVIGAGKARVSSKQKKAEKLVGDGADLKIISEQDFVAMLEAMPEAMPEAKVVHE